MHPRKLIRDAVKVIISALPDFKLVDSSKVHTITEDQLPAAIVYNPREPADRITVVGDLDRRLEIVIDIQFIGDDDEADRLCFLIETALAADQSLTNTAQDSWLTLSEFSYQGEAEKRTGVARLTYVAKYLTGAGPS